MADFITRDGCRIAYRDTGSGDRTLVILPGWSQTAAGFDRTIEQLGPDLRVVSYDHRNHGESGGTDGGARIATLAADLGELLDHLGLDRVHALGHSMGCSVLWSYIDRCGTDRLASTTLVDQPSACIMLPWLEASNLADVGPMMAFTEVGEFVKALLGPDSNQTRASLLDSLLSTSIDADSRVWMLAENMKLPMPFGAMLFLDHMMQDWRDVIPRIDVPTLVVGGEASPILASSQRWIAEQIPGARFAVFTNEQGGAHFPFFEQPTSFAAVLRDFIVNTAPKLVTPLAGSVA